MLSPEVGLSTELLCGPAQLFRVSCPASSHWTEEEKGRNLAEGAADIDQETCSIESL